MRTPAAPLALLLVALFPSLEIAAQRLEPERLSPEVFDAAPPSVRVRGVPGNLAVQARACRTLPTPDTRRRIVDVAAQEWGFFGFRIVDRTEINSSGPFGSEAFDGGRTLPDLPLGGRFRPRLPPEEAARVATSIAGYWAVTPEGTWIVQRQNDEWKGPDGIAARWNAPWSAAFVSWVMCEAGLGTTDRFQRAIAHHAYIDQAIRARDGRAPQAAFVAYDAGDTSITPGDLLCSSRRPPYRTIADRRRQMGVGARTHCDIVVKVDEARARVLVIGGNVRGVVSLKLLRATSGAGKPLRLLDLDEARPIFAHLKLRADAIDAHALDASPTIKAFGCALAARTPAFVSAAHVAAGDVIAARC
jgi:hypothetical protein